jgi:hypothetical protein
MTLRADDRGLARHGEEYDMADFYTDGQRRTRPIRGRKGGSGAAVAVVLAGAVAVAGGGIGGPPSGGGTGASLRVRTTSAKNAARNGQYNEAWRRMGLKAGKKFVRRELRCAVPSYGQVREFFVRTPCRALRRTLLAASDSRGNTVVVAIAWVRMPTAAGAVRLRGLADADGTGNVSPIGSEVLGLTGVRFTGQHYASRRAGSWVVIAETAPGRGQPDPELLDSIAQVAAEYPPP